MKKLKRREFLGAAGGLLGAVSAQASFPIADWHSKAPADPFGCLVDLSVCIGCRKCESNCNRANDLPVPEADFDDERVLDAKRRPTKDAYTVINRYYTGKMDKQNRLEPTYVKSQCMHCQDPACASACLTGAMSKKENGSVHYDKTKCIGCRYCMVACAFQIPAYEYNDPITPRVRKCTFCFERISEDGGKPACAAVCPMEAITFGKRNDLLAMAEKRIEQDPKKYVNKIYGKEEIGGTSWLYISDVAFEKLEFPTLPSQPLPKLPETMQHSLFRYLWSPIVLFFALAGTMLLSHMARVTREPKPAEEKQSK